MLSSNIAITSVYASDAEPAQGGTATVSFRIGDESIGGATFYIYRVASVSSSGDPELIPPYNTYPIDFDTTTSEANRRTAATLEAYAIYSSTPYIASNVTNNSGSITFENLNSGVYLVTGEPVNYNGSYFKAVPELITISDDSENSSPVNLTCSSENIDSYYSPNTGDTIDLTVYAVWNDTGYESNRTNSVTIQLLQNSSVYETVTLDESNDWMHEWTDMDKSATWYVVESSNPSGYNVSVEQEGTSFTVRNTYATGNPGVADQSSEAATSEAVIAPPNTLADTAVDTGTTITQNDSDNNGISEADENIEDESNIPESIPQTGKHLTASIAACAFAVGYVLALVIILLLSGERS